MTWLNINTVNNHLATEKTNDTLICLPKQENAYDSSQKFKPAVQTRDVQRMIHDFLVDCRTDKHINSSLDAVERILFTTAKHCLKIKNVKRRYTRLSSVSSNKKWFDKECRLKRHELRKLANLKHRDPLNITLRENYHTVLKQYKNVLKQKRKEYYHTKISELENMHGRWLKQPKFLELPKSMAESLRSFIVCIVLCVCFYLKLTLRISRFRIIVTHQGKAEDNNNLLYSKYSYRPACTNNIEPLFHSIVRPDWSVALHL